MAARRGRSVGPCPWQDRGAVDTRRGSPTVRPRDLIPIVVAARNACSTVDVVLALCPTLAALDVDGIRGGVSRQEEGWLHPPPNWATRSYLRKTMSSTAYFLTRHTSKERVASLRRFKSFLSVESGTWTSANRMVCSYVKCPSITSPPSEFRSLMRSAR